MAVMGAPCVVASMVSSIGRGRLHEDPDGGGGSGAAPRGCGCGVAAAVPYMETAAVLGPVGTPRSDSGGGGACAG